MLVYRIMLASSALLLTTILGLNLDAQEVEKQQQESEKKADFKFADVEYFHRYTTKDQHEYTPKGQEDLAKWTDMVTINYYRKATDGDGLAAVANAVLKNYQTARAVVVRTDSVPRTDSSPAEHLIVVVFPTVDFTEAAFARLKMYQGVGIGIIYSRRVYGKEAATKMKGWIKTNGKSSENVLMKWDAIPKLPDDR